MKHIFPLLLCAGLLGLFAACQSEADLRPKASATGQLMLGGAYAEPFASGTTRATQTVTDLSAFTFRLVGTDTDGQEVDQRITFQDNRCTLPTGTYTLHVDNYAAAIRGPGAPYYSGTTPSFTIGEDATQTLAIDLGSPKNARVDIRLDASFSELYENFSIAFEDAAQRRFRIYAPGSVYVMVPEGESIPYTLRATARKGTHVADLPAGGVSGTLTVQPGKAHPLTLSAQGIRDLLLLQFGEDTHAGEFDARPF